MQLTHRLSIGFSVAFFALAAAACGASIYVAKRAGCHGAHAHDGKAPPVVGLKDGARPLDPPASAKYRKTQFKTVADVAAATRSSPRSWRRR